MKYKRALPYIAAGIAVVAITAGLIVGGQNTCTAQSCKPQVNQNKEKPMSEIAKIQKELGKGALLVDVRTPEEYAEGHAQGAVNLPYDQIAAGAYPTQDKNTQVYVYCRSGKRASIALDALKQAGYTNASSLVSLSHWQELGGIVIK